MVITDKIERIKKDIESLTKKEKRFLYTSLVINEPKNRRIDGANFQTDITIYGFPHKYHLETLFSYLYGKTETARELLR